jgi:hypothetical protein
MVQVAGKRAIITNKAPLCSGTSVRCIDLSRSRMPASAHPLYFLSFIPCAVFLAVRKDAARRRDILSRVNIVKRIKIGGRWKMFSIPRNAKGNYDWNAIADGRY